MKYGSIPASFLYNLTKNLTTHLTHNPCAMLPIFIQKKRVLARKTHFVKSVIFYLKSVVLFKNN
ncbi:hypothetical protein DW015_03240 [Ruminococcus sp. AF37-20]|nr:hypothetical protein DW015_03240 [Ruminococcus sp. AF37-20]